MEVEQVARDDFGSLGSKLPGTVVFCVHERAHAVPPLEQYSRGGLARLTRGTGDQEETLVVHHAFMPSGGYPSLGCTANPY